MSLGESSKGGEFCDILGINSLLSISEIPTESAVYIGIRWYAAVAAVAKINTVRGSNPRPIP